MQNHLDNIVAPFLSEMGKYGYPQSIGVPRFRVKTNKFRQAFLQKNMVTTVILSSSVRYIHLYI